MSIQVCGAAGVLGVCNCPDAAAVDGSPSFDAPPDAQGVDVTADVDVAPTDSGTMDVTAVDAGVDTGADAGIDLGSSDVGQDAGVDVPRDALPDGCVSTTVGNCCGIACPTPPNGTAACVTGGCGLGSCTSGFGDCDGDPANGCEVTLETAVAHCGACRALCSPDRVCSGAACVMCPTGQTACDGRCLDARADPANCGGCGVTCDARANATPTCMSGACGFTCTAGFGNCDDVAGDGCETNLRASDVNNCGACGRRCPAPPVGAVAVCNVGVCGVSIAMCPAGTGDCDRSAANGCETNTQTNMAHCGGCGMACAPRNATGICTAGSCVLVRCAPGYVDCDGDPSNGCETNPLYDEQNCGACGQTCPTPTRGFAACHGGVCGFTCQGGFADCNRDPSDGCEYSINPPAGSTTCRACGTRCDGNCYDLRTQQFNCGACGNRCASPFFCEAGACVCPARFSVCSGSCVDTATDVNNCGACGTRCASGRVCRASACVIL